MKVKKSALFISTCILLIGLIAGCATVPVREALPTYSLGGVSYLPLISFCELRNINWEYDTFSRTVALNKDRHKINLRIGDRLVLVDGRPQYLRHPPDMYQGTIVVPYKFKEEVLDTLFKKILPPTKVAIPLPRKKIVIDAGHGGRDPGAIGRTGLREKNITLDIAKRLNKLLRDKGMDIVMTRYDDRFISLERRVDIANNAKADFFVSIHANANRVKSLKGFEIYYISPRANDAQRALASARQAVLDLDNSCFASRSQDLKAILWDMFYTHSRAESIELGRSICRSVNYDLDTKILGIKDANFYVLKGVRMPAVLVEVGFLSNYSEERLLRSSYYCQRMAETISKGILNYIRDSALME